MCVLDLIGIKERLDNGYYTNRKLRPSKTNNMKDGYITDENKSVKWNKEQVELARQEYNNKLKEYRDEGYRLEKLFEQDVIDYIRIYHNYNVDVCKLIFDKAYEEAHCSGYEAVLDEVSDIVDFVDLLRDKM